MYCRNCGNWLAQGSAFCGHCGAVAQTEQVVFVQTQRSKPQFHSAGFVLGLLSICLLWTWGAGIILGIIGLPLACISKRKSSIILSAIGIVLGIAFIVFFVWLIANEIQQDWPQQWPPYPSLIQYLRPTL